jgi:hypothetical protein
VFQSCASIRTTKTQKTKKAKKKSAIYSSPEQHFYPIAASRCFFFENRIIFVLCAKKKNNETRQEKEKRKSGKHKREMESFACQKIICKRSDAGEIMYTLLHTILLHHTECEPMRLQEDILLNDITFAFAVSPVVAAQVIVSRQAFEAMIKSRNEPSIQVAVCLQLKRTCLCATDDILTKFQFSFVFEQYTFTPSIRVVLHQIANIDSFAKIPTHKTKLLLQMST